MASDRRKLIAAKSLRYDTRQLRAGDAFEATNMHARLLVGIRKARYAPEKAVPVKPVEEIETKAEPHIEKEPQEQPGDLDRLRREAGRLGIEVDGRWGAIRLQHEIAQARK